MCDHLRVLEQELTALAIPETFRGVAWTANCREWVYFRCYIDLPAVRKRLKLDPCVADHIHDDARSGRERGFVCTEHNDAVIGELGPSCHYPTVS